VTGPLDDGQRWKIFGAQGILSGDSNTVFLTVSGRCAAVSMNYVDYPPPKPKNTYEKNDPDDINDIMQDIQSHVFSWT
jgi:hypothetical protein